MNNCRRQFGTSPTSSVTRSRPTRASRVLRARQRGGNPVPGPDTACVAGEASPPPPSSTSRDAPPPSPRLRLRSASAPAPGDLGGSRLGRRGGTTQRGIETRLSETSATRRSRRSSFGGRRDRRGEGEEAGDGSDGGERDAACDEASEMRLDASLGACEVGSLRGDGVGDWSPRYRTTSRCFSAR